MSIDKSKYYQPSGPAVYTQAGWEPLPVAVQAGGTDRGYGCLVAVLLVAIVLIIAGVWLAGGVM